MLLASAKPHVHALRANGEAQPHITSCQLLHSHHHRLHRAFAACCLPSTRPALEVLGGSLLHAFPSPPALPCWQGTHRLAGCVKDTKGITTLCSLASSLFQSITTQCSPTHAMIQAFLGSVICFSLHGTRPSPLCREGTAGTLPTSHQHAPWLTVGKEEQHVLPGLPLQPRTTS